MIERRAKKMHKGKKKSCEEVLFCGRNILKYSSRTTNIHIYLLEIAEVKHMCLYKIII